MKRMIMILVLILILLLALPGASHAGSYQVPAVGEKSEALKAFEDIFYGVGNASINPYITPLGSPNSSANDKIVSTGKTGTGTGTTGTSTTAAPAAASANNGAFQQAFGTSSAAPATASANDDSYQRAVAYAINNGGTIRSNKDGTYTVVTSDGGSGKNNSGNSSRTFGTPGASAATTAPAQAGTAAASTSVPWISVNGLDVPQPYDSNTLMGQLFNDATKKTYVSNQRYDDLLAQAPQISSQMLTAGDWYFDQAKGDYGNAQNYLSKAGTEGDWWYDKAKGAYSQAEGFIPQIQDQFSYTQEANKWYDDYTRGMLGGAKDMLDTGSIPQPIMDAMLSAMTQGVNQSVGANVNDLAVRGVLNSSVTNRALADASRSVSDSMNANYLDAFNSILGGYNTSAQTGADAGKAFADTNLNIISGMNDTLGNMIGLGDSYGKTGSMRVGDLLGVAQGYTNNAGSLMDAGSQRIADYGTILDSNLKERAALQDGLSNYYVNAAAPMMPAYDLLKTMQQDHWNSNKQDTVVSNGGGMSS
jgi:hypothetical protein